VPLFQVFVRKNHASTGPKVLAGMVMGASTRMMDLKAQHHYVKKIPVLIGQKVLVAMVISASIHMMHHKGVDPLQSLKLKLVVLRCHTLVGTVEMEVVALVVLQCTPEDMVEVGVEEITLYHIRQLVQTEKKWHLFEHLAPKLQMKLHPLQLTIY
jgi:hypothetical protein